MRMVLCVLALLVCTPAFGNEIAVQTIAWEASNQSLEGQIAVASVIKTRMAERKQSAEQVCLAKAQFSCWHPKTHTPTQKRHITPKERKLALLAWEMARVGDYNHYTRHDCRPYWIKAAKKSMRVGSHIFYKL